MRARSQLTSLPVRRSSTVGDPSWRKSSAISRASAASTTWPGRPRDLQVRDGGPTNDCENQFLVLLVTAPSCLVVNRDFCRTPLKEG